jgi:hypothetical protein
MEVKKLMMVIGYGDRQPTFDRTIVNRAGAFAEPWLQKDHSFDYQSALDGALHCRAVSPEQDDPRLDTRQT